MLLLSLPFEWWMPRQYYANVNDFVMGVIYSPLLVFTAWLETREAYRIRWNRRRGEEDDGGTEEWEQVAEDVDFDLDDTWKQEVSESTPNIKIDNCTLEVLQLKEQVAALTGMVKTLTQENKGILDERT